METILIVDDSALNREILRDMLEDEYAVLEACSGREAMQILHGMHPRPELVLLDIQMPELDGFGVLREMERHDYLEDTPVIIISSEGGHSFVEKAYDLGAIDYIGRPFDMVILHRRIQNTLMISAKQKRLNRMIEQQLQERQRDSNIMVNILSHIVEFRNGESGQHVLHVQDLTRLLLTALVKKTGRYALDKESVARICTAAALHDIGKIAIEDSILNKPGRLTGEEYAIMKTHTTIGASMLEDLNLYRDEPLVVTAREICRWHHERYDGNGYPDGLCGEEIPISAQVVAIADVYDALVSERCYKKPYSHSEAVKMILNGECGCFNPLLLECLAQIEAELGNLVRAGGAK